MLNRRLIMIPAGVVTLIASAPAQAGTILYEPSGGLSQINFFEPIGQSFVAEDALVQAGLFIEPINSGSPDTDPILYQLFEGFGVNGPLVADATFNLSEPFSDFRLVDFSATPLTIGTTYTLTASIVGTSPLWGAGITFQAPDGTGVCNDPSGLPCPEQALLVTPVSVPEPTSTLALFGLGILGVAPNIKRKLKPSKSTDKELGVCRT